MYSECFCQSSNRLVCGFYRDGLHGNELGIEQRRKIVDGDMAGNGCGNEMEMGVGLYEWDGAGKKFLLLCHCVMYYS